MNTTLDELERQGLISARAHYVGVNLVAILRHASGGKHASRLWLYQKEGGAWSHSFDPAIAVNGIGGAEIPISCLNGAKLFEPKTDVVTAFLQDYELTKAEIVAIIRANL